MARCSACHYYKNNMCIAFKPKIEKKPFGFPLRYNPKQIKCQSYKERTFDFNWKHL